MAAAASVAGTEGTAGYVWEDPGDSIMIQVSLDLVERLSAAVQQGLGPGQRGAEVGGILLGRILPGFGLAVLVEDFELTPCQYLRGASFTLTPPDRRALGSRLARRPARQVVGYFRSHTRPGMYLDQEDFGVFSQYFPEPWQVFLLVRPSAGGPATGGFFFWEDGEVNRRSSYRQFPFDRTLLAAGDFPITGGQPATSPAPRPAPVLVAKPQASSGRRLPPLPWVVVPAIAVLFLIAGFFVSGDQAPKPRPDPPPVKVSMSVEPLLPEPVPQAPPVVQEVVALVPEPKPKPAKKVLPKTAAPPLVTVARSPSREVEQPPALAVPVERLEPKLPPVPLSSVSAAPPIEAEVSYEAPRPGAFRRALHKISGSGEAEAAGFTPPSPIRQIAPVKPADAGADARPVDVKVSIDESGKVIRAQVLTKGSYMAGAALNAARQWQFTPARKHDKPVASELVLHFR